MAINDSEFAPQAGFIVTAASDFANFNAATLAAFYQPILGPVAFSLFYALKTQLIDNPTLGDRRLQSNILRQLNAGSGQVASALHRLEAVGLVLTFRGSDGQGRFYVYQLQPTLTPAAFVDDDLLSVLLLEAVGESAFNHLVKAAHRYQLASQPKLTNVSHQFLDEFHVATESVTELPAPIKAARRQLTVEIKHTTSAESTDFDWPTLYQLLDGQPIISKDLEQHQRLIEVEHQLYGIDEPTMKKLVLKAVNLSDRHFDPAKFKRVVAAAYQAPAPVEPQSQSANHQKDASGQLTKKDHLLLASVDKYSPVDFLQSLKEQTGGYVTASERHILTHLVADVKLDTAVINILSWYIIADLGNPTLKSSFVDAIANSWLKAGVHDGQSALLQLKAFNQQKAAGGSTNRNRRTAGYRRPKLEEKMPEWSKKSRQERNKKASKEEVQAIQELLAKRKKQ